MAEIAGLVLGVAGLAGLYGLVIEASGQVSVAKSMNRDLEVLAARYDTRRARLLQWGDGVAILSDEEDDQDPKLHNIEVQPVIARTLECIRMLLTDADRLSGRYGLKLLLEGECDGPATAAEGGYCDGSTTVGECEDSAGFLSRYRLRAFNKAYTNLKNGGRRRPSLVSKAKWVLHGAESFRLLLDDLDDLIGDLYTLVPIAARFQRLLVQEDVDNLPEDMQALKLVKEAMAGDAQDSAAAAAASPDAAQKKDDGWLDAISLKVERSEQASLHKQTVLNWLQDVGSSSSPDLHQHGGASHFDPRAAALDAALDPSRPHPAEAILTPEEYAQKKKRRREAHNIVERRRRDAINDDILRLWRLMPKKRVDEVVLEEKCQKYFRLPGQTDDTGTKIPLNPQSSTSEALFALAPFLDVDWAKSPSKGQILKSTVRWVEELSEILVRKFAEEDRMRETIKQLGGWAPFERTAEDQKLRQHIAECLRVLAESRQENAHGRGTIHGTEIFKLASQARQGE